MYACSWHMHRQCVPGLHLMACEDTIMQCKNNARHWHMQHNENWNNQCSDLCRPTLMVKIED